MFNTKTLLTGPVFVFRLASYSTEVLTLETEGGGDVRTFCNTRDGERVTERKIKKSET